MYDRIQKEKFKRNLGKKRSAGTMVTSVEDTDLADTLRDYGAPD